MKNMVCPACSGIIHLQVKIEIHELVSCPHCNSLLELVSQNPPTLDWADDPLVFPLRRTMQQNF